jgi:hypothetical protein
LHNCKRQFAFSYVYVFALQTADCPPLEPVCDYSVNLGQWRARVLLGPCLLRNQQTERQKPSLIRIVLPNWALYCLTPANSFVAWCLAAVPAVYATRNSRVPENKRHLSVLPGADNSRKTGHREVGQSSMLMLEAVSVWCHALPPPSINSGGALQL